MTEDGSGALSSVPTTLMPHTYRWPFDRPFCLRHWQHFTLPNFGRTLRRHGIDRPDLLIVDNVVMARLRDALSPRKPIYRITDHYASFSTTTSAMRAAERAFAPRVDLAVYTANSLRSYAKDLAPKASLGLDHAVDTAFFDRVGKADLVDGINPLKLYEYLIAGLPVITTAWPELERLAAPVIACRSADDFPAAVERALAGEGPDLGSRKAFARKADWQSRVGELLSALDIEIG